MGVWIETYSGRIMFIVKTVTPCVGVWIETRTERLALVIVKVTPCVGVWIETNNRTDQHQYYESHPAWVCGLKQNILAQMHPTQCHTLRGCVD